MSPDPFDLSAGNMQDPQSLHKYLYVHGDPVNGTDPTGMFSLGGLGAAMSIGGVIGGTIGGIDAALGGENIWVGIASGFAFGAVLGGLAYAFPAVFASSFVLGFGLGFSVPFIIDSFKRGKNAQGYFRIFTGILVPIGLRNAAIARLAAASRAAAVQRLAALWRSVNLRTNSYGFELGISGSYVSKRIPLSSEVPPGRYLYVVDAEGKAWLAPIQAEVNGVLIKHSSLVPDGAQVRAAGHMVVKPNKAVNLNSDSGHYMQDYPILPNEEPAWLAAMSESLLDAGLAPGELSPLPGLISD